jgi:predicted nucleic acid-binding protein
MAYKHLFIDSDVLLDMLLTRDPFYFYTQILLIEGEKKGIEISTSTLIIANINYILSKQIGQAAAKRKISDLVKAIRILPFESDIINKALASNIIDFEDAIQHYIAEKYNCEAIITRNTKDYKQSAIPVLTAEQFLKTL